MGIQQYLGEKQNEWFGEDWKQRHSIYWLVSMAGEAGESLNTYKKMWRDGDKLDATAIGMMRERLLTEVADTMVYAYLFADSLGVDLEERIRAKTDTVNQDKYQGRSELVIPLMPPDLK